MFSLWSSPYHITINIGVWLRDPSTVIQHLQEWNIYLKLDLWQSMSLSGRLLSNTLIFNLKGDWINSTMTLLSWTHVTWFASGCTPQPCLVLSISLHGFDSKTTQVLFIYLRCISSQKVNECPKDTTVLSTIVFVVAPSWNVRKRIHSNFPPCPNWYWVLVICSTHICKPQQFECFRSPTKRFQSSRSVHFNFVGWHHLKYHIWA